MQNPPPYLIGSVDRALQTILLLSRTSDVTVAQVAGELGVAPSTAHRILAMLCYRGFAVQDERRIYHPGPQLAGTGVDQRPIEELRSIARPRLVEAYDQLQETMHLVVLLGATVRFVDGVEGTQGLRVGLRTGMRMPAYCTSAGKAMLADLDDVQLARLYPNGLDPWPTRHITDLKALRRHLAAVRRRGYGVNAQESEVGVVAIGVGVRGPGGQSVAGISVAIPSARYDRADEPRFARIVTETARDIEADLAAAGWHAPFRASLIAGSDH